MGVGVSVCGHKVSHGLRVWERGRKDKLSVGAWGESMYECVVSVVLISFGGSQVGIGEITQ